MPVTLYHHPFSRAASVVWMLEEAGCDYTLRYVDFAVQEHKSADILALNPMGKLPILVDGEAVVTETAAIGLYLADRYAPGRLAPALDDPARGTYLRWSLFAPSVIEPGAMAQASRWEFRPGAAGFGTYEAMLGAMEAAVGEGPWLLGDRFTMADAIFGSTLRWLVGFGMIEKRDTFLGYIERLGTRPALREANERNAAVIEERGLKRG